VPIPVIERVITISRCHLMRSRSWFSLGVNDDENGWLKPPFISLSVRYGGSSKWTAREGLVYPFFQKSHAEFLTSQRRSAHASSAFTGSATPPLQRPCEVKEMFDEGLPPED
jgi:hypothetical protein